MSQLDDLLEGLLGEQGGLGGLAGGPTGLGGRGAGGLMAAVMPMLGGILASGGLSKILSRFQAQGLGSRADSWVGIGPNEPVTAGQVQQVIGNEEIAQIADTLGVSHEEAAQAIAEVLPQLVDRVSPDGQLPPEQDLDQAFDRLSTAVAPT